MEKLDFSLNTIIFCGKVLFFEILKQFIVHKS